MRLCGTRHGGSDCCGIARLMTLNWCWNIDSLRGRVDGTERHVCVCVGLFQWLSQLHKRNIVWLSCARTREKSKAISCFFVPGNRSSFCLMEQENVVKDRPREDDGLTTSL